MNVISLASSSEANCFLVWTDSTILIIDAGISAEAISKKIKLLNLEEKNIKALLISHEHLDHSRYLFTIAEKFNIPICIDPKTLKVINLKNKMPKPKKNTTKVLFFKNNKPFRISEFIIYPVAVIHDAISPFGFGIKYENFRVSYFVDLNRVDKNVWEYIAKSNLVIIDSNYDRKMLINGKYPYSVKKRIINKAHLSNEIVANIIAKHPNKYKTEFWLAHLSKENNSPETAKKTIEYVSKKLNIKMPLNYKILPQRAIGPIWSTDKYSQLSLQLKQSDVKHIISNFYINLNEQQKEKFDITMQKVVNIKNFKYEVVKTKNPDEYAWKVDSSSDPDEVYVVAKDIPIVGINGVKIANIVWSCECADFIFRCQKLGLPCKHILKLLLTF